MTTPREDYAFRLGVATYAVAFDLPAPDSAEELLARIERLDADTYAAIHGALERASYPAFQAAVQRVRGVDA